MALAFIKRFKTPSEVTAEVIDIDVTPVMNMFIILIPFLVSMAAFTHLAILDFSLPPNVGTGLDMTQGKPKLKVTVVVARDFLAITHGENMLDSIPLINNVYDYETFFTRLQVRREQADINDEVVVAVQNAVVFQKVVDVMDRCRKAGFEKVGLSSAPEETEQKY